MRNLLLFVAGLMMSSMAILTTCCDNAKQVETLTYYGFDRSTNEVFDTLTVRFDGEFYELLANDFFGSSRFIMTSISKDQILFGTDSCMSNTIVRLNVGEQADNPCPEIPPFIGGQITILDSKKINVDGQEFEVFKIYNAIGNSDEDGSAIYWLNGIGVICINLSNGRYYELQGKEKSNIPILQVLRAVNNDLDFSDRQPVPPAPPPPDISISE